MSLLSRARRVCLALLLVATAPLARGDDAKPLVDYLNDLRSFSAKFEQQRFDETGELLETAHGECHIQRPGRFRWNYLDPYVQTIVSDGHKLWIHDVDLAQVTVNEVKADAPGTPAELLSAEFDVRARYTITHDGARDGYDWYSLAPKDPAAQFNLVELGLADGEVQAMRLKDNLGQSTLLHFDHVQRNVPLDASLFQFTPPPGADVVEGGAP